MGNINEWPRMTRKFHVALQKSRKGKIDRCISRNISIDQALGDIVSSCWRLSI